MQKVPEDVSAMIGRANMLYANERKYVIPTRLLTDVKLTAHT